MARPTGRMDRPHEHIQATFWEECLSGTKRDSPEANVSIGGQRSLCVRRRSYSGDRGGSRPRGSAWHQYTFTAYGGRARSGL